MDQPRASSPFHLMIKPVGADCNLACEYCYYRGKRSLYPGSDFRMADEVLEQATRAYLRANPAPEVVFGWQGGEPLLAGLDFYRRAVALQAECADEGQRVSNTLQTNGTLLDEEWCEFLREHGFLVGLSLDGPRAAHDAYRRDPTGGPTFDRVMTAANAGRPVEVYRFFRDEVGARFIQFIPIVEPVAAADGGTSVSERSVSGDEYGRFLSRVFDEWVQRDVGTVFVQTFDSALASWLGGPAALCVFAEECGRALVLEHNGDLYACDHFVRPEYRLGNIMESPLAEMVDSEQQQTFGRAKREALPAACGECHYLFACRGGCPKNRLIPQNPGEPASNHLCAGYRYFFAHIDLVRRGRPAAEVMQSEPESRPAEALPYAGTPRNAPCPCGSGRKYKHCHGRRAR